MNQQIFGKLLLLVYFFVSSISPMVAIVIVTSEEATIVAGFSEPESLEFTNVYRGEILIVYGCDSYQWRRAYNGAQDGSIHLSTVEPLFGRLPSCDNVESTIPAMPRDVIPNERWNEPTLKLKYIC